MGESRTFKGAITYRRFNSGGPGGQHQNTTENAVEASLDQAVADELGIPAVSATASLKSQHASKRGAAKMLASRIKAALENLSAKLRFSAGTNRVRNYHQPDNRVTDSTGLRWPWRETLGKSGGGDIAKCIDGRRAAKLEEKDQ